MSAVLKLQFAMPGLAHLLLPVGALQTAPVGIGPGPFIGMAFVGTGAPFASAVLVHGPPGPSSSVPADAEAQLTVEVAVTVKQPGKSVSTSNPRAAARQPLCNILSILCMVSSCCCVVWKRLGSTLSPDCFHHELLPVARVMKIRRQLAQARPPSARTMDDWQVASASVSRRNDLQGSEN